MSAVNKKNKIGAKSPEQLELYRSPEFQFKYWESSLFNETYLRNDLHNKHDDVWNSDSVEFQNFFDKIKNLFHAFDGDEKDMNNWTETETINLWVKEVLNALGWDNRSQGPKKPYLEETSFRSNGRTYRTDILIVDMPDEAKYIKKLKGDEKVDEAKRSVLIPVEVKYWNRLEQFRQGKSEERNKVEKKDSDELSLTTSPNEQTTKYMEMLNQNWGILTDGARWRLFNKELSVEEPNRFFEFNLFSLFQSYTTEETDADRREIEEAAKYFFNFFSKSSLFPEDHSVEPFPNEILRYSKKYISHVEENLKDRFIDAMNFACNGFYQVAKENKIDVDLTFIRSISESCLFNILFTKSLESRGVLPMNTPDYRDLSLSSIVDKIDLYDPNRDEEINLRDLRRAYKRSNTKSFDYTPEGTQIHDKIVRLAKIIHDGNSDKDDFGFEIAGFRESVFDTKEWKFFTNNKLPNSVWVDVLFQLGYAESDLRGHKHQQIPYAYFTPRQLGSIYEGFLEYQLDEADQDMIYEKKQWKKADLKSKKYKNQELPKVNKGALFFTPDNKDRKATGSYYTPDYIVQYIVEESLNPLTKGKSSVEILNLKVCDPAMGSGHFLVGALNYLTSSYLKALADESEGDLKITQPEAKRKVLDACIYGVDINPRAVKLACMSLWLESAFVQHKLERLDDQIKCGNSLESFAWDREFGFLFNAVIGNPPYIASKNQSVTSVSEGQSDLYIEFLNKSLDLLNDKGVMSMIVPDPILIRKNGLSFRKKVLKENFYLKKCVHMGGVFDAAKVSNVIVVVCKSADQGESIFIRVKGKSVGLESIKDSAAYPYDIRDSICDSEHRFCYLKSGSDNYSKVSRLKNKLSSYFSDSRGEEISKKDVLDKGSFKVLRGGESIGKFSIKYDRSGYIDKVKKKIYDKEKLLLQKSSPNFICACDRTGIVVPQSVYILVEKEHAPVDLDFLCGYLNSDALNEYLFCTATGYKILMPHFEQKDLKNLPFPDFNFNRQEFERCKKEVNVKDCKIDILNSKPVELAAYISVLSSALNIGEDEKTTTINKVVSSLVSSVNTVNNSNKKKTA